MKRVLLYLAVVLALIVGGCSPAISEEDGIIIHFIDVGQGDSALIQYGSRGILIDAGEKDSGVREYMKAEQIGELDYIIATHPHSDHIGGLADVISSVPVNNILMPKVAANTSSYENLLLAIKEKSLKIKAPLPGEIITVPVENLSSSKAPKELSLVFLAPNSGEYEATNDYSIVFKLVYGGVSYLFTGDAGMVSENEMSTRDLSADVLKIGHHGSRGSTSELFLQAVEPAIAVISSGKDNSYGHPHEETINRLSDAGIRIFRTDESGTIVMKTDGNNIYVRD